MADESTREINGQFAVAIEGAIGEGGSGGTRRRQAERLQALDLGAGEGVADLGDVNVASRVLDAGHGVGGLSGIALGAKDVALGTVAEAGEVAADAAAGDAAPGAHRLWRSIGMGEDDGGSAVAGEAAVEPAVGGRHHGRGEHIVDRYGHRLMRPRITDGVAVVLDRDVGHLLGRSAIAHHVFCDGERVERHRRRAGHAVDLGVERETVD